MATPKRPMPAKPPTEDQIRRLLETSDAAVEEGILRLHARQTQDEQRSKDTKHRNNRGFSACHAKRGSRYAEWITGMRRNRKAKPGEGLRRADHKAEARKLVLHYVKQLHAEAVDKWTTAHAEQDQAAHADVQRSQRVEDEEHDARRAVDESAGPFEVDLAEETDMIQRADRKDAEQAAASKLYRDREMNPLLRAHAFAPGTMVALVRDSMGAPSLDAGLRSVVPLAAGTTGLIITAPSRVPGMRDQTKVLFGSRTLWVAADVLRTV